VAASTGHGFATSGNDQSVVMFDLKTSKVLGRIPAAEDADAIMVPARIEYSGDDPIEFVLAMNAHRRHFDASQRAMIAGKLANMRQGERTDLGQICTKSIPQAAGLLNVGKVKQARKVLDSGVPELAKAVEGGKIAVSEAAQIAGLEMTAIALSDPPPPVGGKKRYRWLQPPIPPELCRDSSDRGHNPRVCGLPPYSSRMAIFAKGLQSHFHRTKVPLC